LAKLEARDCWQRRMTSFRCLSNQVTSQGRRVYRPAFDNSRKP